MWYEHESQVFTYFRKSRFSSVYPVRAKKLIREAANVGRTPDLTMECCEGQKALLSSQGAGGGLGFRNPASFRCLIDYPFEKRWKLGIYRQEVWESDQSEFWPSNG